MIFNFLQIPSVFHDLGVVVTQPLQLHLCHPVQGHHHLQLLKTVHLRGKQMGTEISDQRGGYHLHIQDLDPNQEVDLDIEDIQGQGQGERTGPYRGTSLINWSRESGMQRSQKQECLIYQVSKINCNLINLSCTP